MSYPHLFTWSSSLSLFTSSSRNPWYSWLAWVTSSPWGSFRPPFSNGSTWRPRYSCRSSFPLVPLCSSFSRKSQRTLDKGPNKVVKNKKYVPSAFSCLHLNPAVLSVLVHPGFPYLPFLLSAQLEPLTTPVCPQPPLDWTPAQRTGKQNKWQ